MKTNTSRCQEVHSLLLNRAVRMLSPLIRIGFLHSNKVPECILSATCAGQACLAVFLAESPDTVHRCSLLLPMLHVAWSVCLCVWLKVSSVTVRYDTIRYDTADLRALKG